MDGSLILHDGLGWRHSGARFMSASGVDLREGAHRKVGQHPGDGRGCRQKSSLESVVLEIQVTFLRMN